MEDKRLNEKESLELITRMIQNTKQNLEVGDGNIFIIWGVSIFIVNIATYLTIRLTNNPMGFWVWMLVPIIGTLWSKLTNKKTSKITTKIDKMISTLWKVIIGLTLTIPIFCYISTMGLIDSEIIASESIMMTIPMIEIIIVSMGLIATSIMIDFKPLKIGSCVGIFYSLFLLIQSLEIYAITIGIWTLITMIIPGVKLNYYIKRKKND